MAEVVMPRLSDSMEEGTILQWLKQPGEEVAVGEELVEIETDKANMAYESDLAGTLTEILVPEGETVAIGTPIARIGDLEKDQPSQPAGPVAVGDPPPPPVAEASSGAGPPTAPPAGETGVAAEAPDAADGRRPKASPIARRLAKEQKLDLSQIRGSGPGGRIVKADVEKALAAGPGPGIADAGARPGPSVSPPGRAGAEQMPDVQTAKGQVTYEDLSKLQATVARRMAESKATAPHFYLQAEVDMSRAVEGRGGR
jgi:pyruvate dehydrogenase E2 component (dihydrolipoamide acetyltransferase)